GTCSGACFSPDGQALAVAVGDVVQVVDGATGKRRHILKGFVGDVRALAYHPSGTRLAVLDEAGLRVCAAGDRGGQLLSLRGTFDAVAFSRDGTFWIAAGQSGLTIWDAGPRPPLAVRPAAKPAPEKPPSTTPPPDPRPPVVRAAVKNSVDALEKGDPAAALL